MAAIASQPRARSTWDFAAGHEIVPHRTMQAQLGGGARFEVYLAWNHRLMRPTVLKVLRPSNVDVAGARRRLTREGELLSRLEHPGLARLVGMDADGQRPFIEMEYVDGPRLSTLVRRHGRLNPDQMFPLGRQLAATLDFLHGAGVVHLDVKPSNIVMGSTPTLIDLSVARTVERATRINGYVGTDAYMSAEQADPGLWATIGPKADAWGLGATVYYAVAGRPPHSRGRRDASGGERFPQLVESPAPLDPRRHSPGLVELVMDALRRRPEDRPDAGQLFERFDDLTARARSRTRTRTGDAGLGTLAPADA